MFVRALLCLWRQQYRLAHQNVMTAIEDLLYLSMAFPVYLEWLCSWYNHWCFLQVAQVLAGVAIPGEPAEWQKLMLKAVGIDGPNCNVKLAYSNPMFDWRLVAAARILCASDFKELQGMDLQQMGQLDVPLPSNVEVHRIFLPVTETAIFFHSESYYCIRNQLSITVTLDVYPKRRLHLWGLKLGRAPLHWGILHTSDMGPYCRRKLWGLLQRWQHSWYQQWAPSWRMTRSWAKIHYLTIWSWLSSTECS